MNLNYFISNGLQIILLFISSIAYGQQTPYKTLTVPGTIQAEDYDNGGEGIAYHDVDALNSGGKYRTNGVDIEGTTIINVGWTFAGEWLEYTPTVSATGTYKIDFRVSSPVSTGQVQLQADGVTLGTVSIPNTGGWQNYQSVSFNATLAGGTKVLRLNILKGDVNIDWMGFTFTSTPTDPQPAGPVTVGSTVTLPPGSPATVVGIATPTGTRLDFGIPQGIQGPAGPQGAPGSSTGGGTGSQPRAYFVATDFGAKGDGVTDDTNALQSFFDAVMRANGFGTIPSPPNFYKITRTLNMGLNPTTQSYSWFDIQGSGQPGFSIVYMGASGQDAIKIWGMKGGSIRGVRVKIGNGITNSACWNIGTLQGTTSNSTSCFTFYDCSVELNKGTGNAGWLIGGFGPGGDVSQILWNNCTAWGGGGASGASISGQDGWRFDGNNALQFTWVGGSSSYAEHAVELNAGGAMYFWGFGGSQNRVDYYFNHSNTSVMSGNRWESGRQHIVTTPRASHMSITEIGSTVADYMPDNGRLYELRQPGTLILDGLKIEKRHEIGRGDFGSEMIYIESSGKGSLFVRGGAFHAAEPFYTLKNPGTWYIDIKGVGRMDQNYNSTTQYQNK
jgi:hypothetical protein